jgi:hypothetical protein
MLVVIGLTALAPSAWAQSQASSGGNDRVLRVLGGSTRFSTPVPTIASLKKMAAANRRDITTVLGNAGLSNIAPQVLDALTSGAVVETTFAPGGHLDWMSLRRKGKPDIVRNLQWGGAKAFAGYRFTVATATMVYTFIVPKACANLSLVSAVPVAPAAAAAPAPAPRPAAAAPPPPPPPPPAAAAGAGPGVAAAVTQTPAAAPAASGRRFDPFILGAFGKQRRMLEDSSGSVLGSFCDPLFGIKGGVQFQVKPHLMLAPAVGVAINMDEGGRSSLFADFEVNRTFDNGGYVGTGLGVWDFNHGDNVTPNLLIHVGVPMAHYADNKSKVLFAVETRLFFDHFTDTSNNYQFWAGVRYIFR